MRLPLIALALAAALAPAPARAVPANTLHELWATLGRCLADASPNDVWELTIVFSLKRSGELLGKPRLTYAKLPPEGDQRKRITDKVAQALDGCLPISITDGLGGAIAGRPLSIRLVGKKQERDI